MRRFHNPRYAPEFLERKLSPSNITPVAVAAEIHVPTTTATATMAASATHAIQTTHTIHSIFRTPADNTDTGGDPPIDTPTVPTGPALPA